MAQALCTYLASVRPCVQSLVLLEEVGNEVFVVTLVLDSVGQNIVLY
jgi:hypothetical protein